MALLYSSLRLHRIDSHLCQQKHRLSHIEAEGKHGRLSVLAFTGWVRICWSEDNLLSFLPSPLPHSVSRLEIARQQVDALIICLTVKDINHGWENNAAPPLEQNRKHWFSHTFICSNRKLIVGIMPCCPATSQSWLERNELAARQRRLL